MQNCGRNLLCDHPLLARLRKLLIYGVSYDLTREFQWILQGDCIQPNKGVSAQKAREFQPGRQGSFSLASQGSVSLASQGSFSVASSQGSFSLVGQGSFIGVAGVPNCTATALPSLFQLHWFCFNFNAVSA